MARATNIRPRGNSFVVYFRVGGRQVQKSFAARDYGGKVGALEAAKLYFAQSQARKIQGTFRRPTKILFRDFAREWLRDYAKGNVKVRTLETYEGSLRNHLIPELGDLYLSEISRKTIDALVADWLSGGPRYQERLRVARELEAKRAKEEKRDPRAVRLGRAPGTISNAITPLREMLGHAVEWEYLVANPAAGVRRPRVERTEMRFLSPDAVRALLEKAKPEWRTLFLCAVTTGMRRGELVALRWGDVDWQSSRIWVRRNANKHGDFQEPKSRGSVRAIAMPASLVSALRLHRMASLFKGEDDLIFSTPKGTLLDGHNVVEREFKPTLRRAGLPTIRFHDLRHTFASPHRSGCAPEADLGAARARERPDHPRPLRPPHGPELRRRERQARGHALRLVDVGSRSGRAAMSCQRSASMAVPYGCKRVPPHRTCAWRLPLVKCGCAAHGGTA